MSEYTRAELKEWLMAKSHQLNQSPDHEFDDEDASKMQAIIDILENEKALE